MTKNANSKAITCSYCGDAPINHNFSYAGNIISLFFDSVFGWTLRWVPRFAVRIVDGFLKWLLEVLVILKLVKLSSDSTKAATLRSRVVWEEAERRGIKMQQLVIFGKYTDNYRALVAGKYVYFNSLPLPEGTSLARDDWDDKFFMKKQLSRENIPVPMYAEVPLSRARRRKFFDKFAKPLIVKPRLGSRGRHTITNVNTWEEFESAIALAKEICPRIIAEEHLEGYVCRATCVDGKLVGFYRAESAQVTGDGKKTVRELIEDKNFHRGERIEPVEISEEITDFILRRGYVADDVLPAGERLWLSHRVGRFFGGATREMLEALHPSFVPYLEKASRLTGLSVVGLDCVVRDPEASAEGQRWGIIECNTLPFIDLHYFALEGEPQNIAGMIWDFWEK